MGEAKKKRRQHEKLLVEYPMCCYCGGSTLATTADHVPSRQLFWEKRRPKGLEVPACESCNRATSNEEQNIAFFSRIFPDPVDENQRKELARIAEQVSKYSPGLIPEMASLSQEEATRRKFELGIPGEGMPINANGPILNETMMTFGRKLGLALHFDVTKQIVSPTGGVVVKWFTNLEILTSDWLADEINRFFPNTQTLEQGTWHVGDQFGYSSSIVPDGSSGAYVARFRQSFVILCGVTREGNPGFTNLGEQILPPFNC